MMNVETPWTVYRTRFVVRARQLTEPLTFTDVLGRDHSGQPGDYLVESSQGFLRITPQALFEDIYVPLEERQAGPPPPRDGIHCRPVTLDRRVPVPQWRGPDTAGDRSRLAARGS